jgi:hypothetical protein
VARNVRVLILALLCVLAVTLAAATLTNPTTDTPGSAGGPSPFQEESPDDPEDDQSGADGNATTENDRESGSVLSLSLGCLGFLLSPTFIVGALTALVVLIWVLKRHENLVYALAVVFPLLMFLIPVYLAFTDCGSTIDTPSGGPMGALENSTDPTKIGGTASETTQQLMTPLIVLGLLVVVAVVLAYLTVRASGDDTVEPEETTPEVADEGDDGEALAAVGAAAGRAADRIEEPADVDNEVFRAWREMTGHLNVENPDASTPTEFADVAREAGMDGEHVERLTNLFRDVRYGGRSPTEDREQEAVDALRAIEETYAGGEE